ncbi:uncharacterized protein [Henckelia pumila]|uniref:uncharacterized protein n=1 Tax=Henckelia pumila TaxID=405737 RepID=UPI003C6DE4A2
MKDFRAVASTYHQKLKFPVGREVRMLRGDHRVARRCYEGVWLRERFKHWRRRNPKVVELGASGEKLKIAADLETEVKEKLVICLKANLDVFAWSIQELRGIKPAVMEHKLNLLSRVFPVMQKKRHFGPDKDKVIKEEIEEFLKAGHIREVQFPTWLSNVVLVPKSSGRWRMCVDFRDLNKECPKDCYPLPRIDQLVDSTAGHQYLCLMDSYQGYHQIPLAMEDQDKKYLAELPVLAKPVDGEGLWVYLSASEAAVSSVLVKKEGSTQKSVYYVSHALKGAELRYSGLEKLVLAIVMTARRLRPYFLSHPIVVLTNSPLGRILTHPNVSGWLVKWVTELGEYDIQYETRTVIKEQALADFLTKTVHLENEDPWKVYVDGSSSIEGSGVGVVLISPMGEEMKLAVKLDFKASNNEAEYEAVLAGLWAARSVGVVRIHFFSDSQLVAQQMKGAYDVKNEKLIEYAREMDRAKEQFAEVVFEHIPRRENKKADALAKMAGSMGSWKTRDVVLQVELAPHMSSVIPELAEEDCVRVGAQ